MPENEPFYSEKNQAELRREIGDIEAGKNLTLHELIELEDEKGSLVTPVAAAILAREGKILLSGCEKPGYYGAGLCWEFPGGKLEPGESPERALERELFEELGIRARIGRVVHVARDCRGDLDLLLMFYRCELVSGEPRPLEGQELRWARPDELPGFFFAPADQTVAGFFASGELNILY